MCPWLVVGEVLGCDAVMLGGGGEMERWREQNGCDRMGWGGEIYRYGRTNGRDKHLEVSRRASKGEECIVGR